MACREPSYEEMEHGDTDFGVGDSVKQREIIGIIRFCSQFPGWIQKQARNPEAVFQFLGGEILARGFNF